jgi:hypothetical protein
MHSWAQYYRRRAAETQQRAAEAWDPSIRAAFEQAAETWLALAERVEWLESNCGG